MWFLIFGAMWSFAAPINVLLWMHSATAWGSFFAALLWSAYIDYCFFRWVFQQSGGRAARSLLLQRAVSWTLGMFVFSGTGLLPEFVRIFGG